MKQTFTFENKQYELINGELFRPPQMIGKSFYGLKKCARWRDGFYLGSKPKSMAQIKGMIELKIDKCSNCDEMVDFMDDFCQKCYC